MKKIFFLILLPFILNANGQLGNFDAFILKALNKNSIVIAANQTKRIKPASLIKIMTAIIALESGKLNKTVTITKESVLVEPTKAGFKEGEKVLLKDLVHSALISSSNDSATAIAIYLGGSVEGFSNIMNKKAKSLGMNNSNFITPSGLDAPNHYSTAKDLLTLSEYSIRNKIFNNIVKMKEYKFSSNERTYYSKSSNKLLNKYNKTIGIKTGYTSKAGPCLIARAKEGNKDFLLIMLDSKVNRWETAEKIFNQFLRG